MATITGTDGNDTLDRRTESTTQDFIDGGRGNDIIYGSLDPSNVSNILYGGRRLNNGDTDNDVVTGGHGRNTFFPLFGNDRYVGIDHSRDADFDGFGDIVNFSGIGNVETEFGIGYNAGVKGSEVDLAAGTYSADVYAFRDPLPSAPSHVTSGSLFNVSQVAAARGDPESLMTDKFFGSNNRPGTYEVFDPNNGDDLVDGRGGFDFISYSLSSIAGFDLQPVTIDLAKGRATDREGGTDTLRNIEGAIGSPAGDKLLGNADDNILRPGLPGLATQGDTMDGRDGIDLVDYSGFGPVNISLVRGTATAGGGATDQLRNIEDARGGDGNDTILGSTGANKLEGGPGADGIVGGAESDTLLGGDGGDDLKGGRDSDRLIGGPGEDMIDGGDGEDILAFDPSGPLGVNVLLKTGAVLDPWGDSDTVQGIETVVGTDKKDLIQGDDDPNTIKGGDGPDNLGGQGGNDTIYGGDGKDAIGGGEGDDRILGGKGPDRIFGGAGRDSVSGGDQIDQIFGGDGGDTLEGGDGDDEIKDPTDDFNLFDLVNRASNAFDPVAYAEGKKDANHLKGDSGEDKLLGTGLLEGGADNDTLRGTGILSGGGGGDLVAVDSAFDANGDDYALLIGGRGNDILDGSGGTSTRASYFYSGRSVLVDTEAGTASAGPKDRDTLIDVFTIYGSGFDDRLLDGPSDESFFSGEAGDDRLKLVAGRGDQDGASGGDGNDRITATGPGRARINGGEDNDEIAVNVKKAEVAGGSGNDKITVRGIAKFKEEHEINGNGDADTIIFAGTGFVDAAGGSGDDRFILRSGQGRFELNGGRGADTYDLRGGADTFVLVEDPRPGEDRFLIKRVLPTDVSNFAQLKNHARQDFGDVTIDLTTGSLVLMDLRISELTPDMFDL